jgi:hypothetical protein
MQRVEQRLEIVPAQQKDIEVVKKALQLIEQLEISELDYEKRLNILRSPAKNIVWSCARTRTCYGPGMAAITLVPRTLTIS